MFESNGRPHATAEAIRVQIDYRVAEYRAIVGEYATSVDMAGAPAGPRRPWPGPVTRLVLALLVPPVVWFNKLRTGRCAFEFDASGLRRTAKGRTAIRSWYQVSRVVELPSGFLIELHEGATYPIPYRALSPIQLWTLRGLIRTRCRL
ncbi:MAG TPA: YcxB family protein [Ideonella sp.]|uniref:YcxB family protein n=1 Tax=Ideonella sp. TaxID=1929293 RepID=UPI002E34F55A|nr:YcxB family protein [Ideonella sp.]HEX5688172.1 YcxB family protein [Ideonella sp.]